MMTETELKILIELIEKWEDEEMDLFYEQKNKRDLNDYDYKFNDYDYKSSQLEVRRFLRRARAHYKRIRDEEV